MSNPVFLNYVKAGYPLLWIETFEEYRAMTVFARELSNTKYTLYSWDRIDGIRAMSINKGVLSSAKVKSDEETDDPIIALDWADKNMGDDAVIFLKDYHH